MQVMTTNDTAYSFFPSLFLFSMFLQFELRDIKCFSKVTKADTVSKEMRLQADKASQQSNGAGTFIVKETGENNGGFVKTNSQSSINIASPSGKEDCTSSLSRIDHLYKHIGEQVALARRSIGTTSEHIPSSQI